MGLHCRRALAHCCQITQGSLSSSPGNDTCIIINTLICVYLPFLRIQHSDSHLFLLIRGLFKSFLLNIPYILTLCENKYDDGIFQVCEILNNK